MESGIRLGGAVPRIWMWPLSQFEIGGALHKPTRNKMGYIPSHFASLLSRFLLFPHPRPHTPSSASLSRPGA